MDDGLPPSDERPPARPPAAGQRPRASQPADPRKAGQPRAAGAAKRQPSRAARPVIDPLLAASRGESSSPAEPRPRAKRAAPRAQPQARDASRDESRDVSREIARDATQSQPLTIRDDPSMELSSPSGAIRRPRPDASRSAPRPEPLFDDQPLFADEPRDRTGSIDRTGPIDRSGPIDRPSPVVVPVIVPASPDQPPPPPVRTPVTPPPPPAARAVDIAATQAIPADELPDAVPQPVARQVFAPRPPTSTAVGHRPRTRRVTRVVRHVDAWSVFKVALVFHLFLYFVVLTAGVLLWQVAQNTGTVDNVERFFESFGWKSFTLHGGEIFHNAWVAGLFGVIGLTGLAVLMATLFNLITDLVGGIRLSVLEEESLPAADRGVGWRRALGLPDRVGDRNQPG